MNTPLEAKEMKGLFYKMLMIRRFEEKAAEMYARGKIGGFLHLYIGQEAVGVGSISALREDDYVISAYREHGHCMVKGVDPKRIMAELFGKATGVSKGKGGSMHLFDGSVRFMGGHAIVSGHLPLAVGIAYAIKYRGGDQVVLCLFGEGAVNQGAFHESFNAAALWKLPVIFICENNRYGMGTPVERATAIYHVYESACAYDMPRFEVDGMDVLAVRGEVESAIKRARQNSMPTFIEAKTYRFMGHSMSDPAHYRTKEELEEQKKRDPIVLFRTKLLDEGVITQQEARELDDSAKRVAVDAAKYADESSEPDIGSITKDLSA